jgi:hypothetical protein
VFSGGYVTFTSQIRASSVQVAADIFPLDAQLQDDLSSGTALVNLNRLADSMEDADR